MESHLVITTLVAEPFFRLFDFDVLKKPLHESSKITAELTLHVAGSFNPRPTTNSRARLVQPAQ